MIVIVLTTALVTVLLMIVIWDRMIETVSQGGGIVIAMDNNNTDRDNISGWKEHYEIRHGTKIQVFNLF